MSDRSPLPAPLRALLGAAVAVAFFGLLEGALWVVGLPDPGLYEGDPAWLWTLRPGLDRAVPGPAGPFQVRTNALGLRGSLPPQDGPWTLVLGCSTTFGWGVEEDEAWPARLAARTGEIVVNGGVPGWSSEQAVRGAERWLALAPTRVVLAYGVRDAWPARAPDRAARPTPWLLRTRFARLIRGGGASPDPGRRAGETARVPPVAFAENMQVLRTMAGDAAVVQLWFPQAEPRDPWRHALERLGPALAPPYEPSWFFEADPVHLTVAGNDAFAAWVAANL